MTEIGIGIIGGGYMGKAHAVAMTAVGPIFNTALRPRLEMVAATSAASAERYRAAYGFARATDDWAALVQDPRVDAVVIASPQTTHLDVVRAAVAAGKHILCEKPLGKDLAAAREIEALATKAGIIHMTGFNYIRTPASQFARNLLAQEEIGTPSFFRIEHTEDFLADPNAPANWRTESRATGTMGDLAPHPINAALALGGPIDAVMADISTAFATRPGPDGPVPVKNDDTAQIMCRFQSGATGHIFSSRVATGRKMGYAYDIYGSAGAIRFDGEDQNALWLYRMDAPHDGFQKILIGPQHPDYLPFCQGPGHGTGYQDQITIEAKDFLEAIATNTLRFPTFADGRAVAEVVEAAHQSFETGRWTKLSEIA